MSFMLSDDKIASLRDLRISKNYSIKKIAKELNIGKSTASYYCSLLPENEAIKKRNADIRNNKTLSSDLTYMGLLNKKLRTATKEFLLMISGGKCCVCEYNKSKSALVFHHIDPSEKSFAISGTRLTHNKEKLLEEVQKCALLCHNCHAEYHEGLIPKEKLVRIVIDKSNIPAKLIEWYYGIKYYGRTFVKLQCPQCNNIFEREKNKTHLVIKTKKLSFCTIDCSRRFYSSDKAKDVKQEVIEELVNHIE